ncbi:MAG: single-stranded-DNA-specific exonuclease RecJ [Planctomycetota bacterium]|jgi:single-stranded-DNA-specific exonuclease
MVKKSESMNWSVPAPDPEVEGKLASALGLYPLTARLLLNRGFRDPSEAARFLHPKLEDLHDPFSMKDMTPAVSRLRDALFKKERILVLGDFDADGVTSTALLIRLLRQLHGDVGYHIPQRLEEGYGLHEETMERLAAEGTSLLVSVDAGITAGKAVAKARSLGMDVIITDHHEPAGPLPECTAVIDPKREDETYPFRDLSGVGVAFKLAWALVKDVSSFRPEAAELKGFLWESLGLVALGTVADVVPLSGENRILVKHGLKALAATRNPGERALLMVAGTEKPGAGDLAFRLGPRINAAGRLGDSRLGVDTLLSDSFESALERAKTLDRMNRRRQEIEREIFDQAHGRVLAEGMDREPAIVLEGDQWHAGVIGIVAAKLADAFSRPVVLIALQGDEGRGSARSIPSLDIHKALGRCAENLLSFGGHAQAAGMTLSRERLGSFRDDFQQTVADSLSEEDLVPRLAVEAEVSLSDLNNAFLSELDLFPPFGKGNPEPVLGIRGGSVAGKPKRLGARRNHLSFYYRQGDLAYRAIAFGFGDRAPGLEGARADLAFVPTINRFRGRETLELRVEDIRTIDPR